MGFIWLLKSMILFILYHKTYLFQDTTVGDVSRNEGQSCENGWIYKDFFEVLSIRTNVKYWWFGLHDQDLDGIYSWVDETDVDYTNWRSDEPYGDYGSGNCVSITYRIDPKDQGKWYVLPCENTIPYLCQKQTTAAVSTVTENDITTYLIQDTTIEDVSKKEGTSCEDGWIYKKLSVTDQYCFKMEKRMRSWIYASRECKKMNGNLVSIHSEKQNDNLENIAKETGVNYWWIGLYEQDWNTTFFWDDNSELNYTKWRPDEPDRDYLSGDCVAISFPYGLWFVFPCWRPLPYLCQKQPVSTITTTETETETQASAITTTETENSKLRKNSPHHLNMPELDFWKKHQ